MREDEVAEFRHLSVKEISGALGAEVEGTQLGALDEAALAEIHAALMRYGVLGFRDQHLDDAQQIALAERFGTPSVHPVEAFFGAGGALQSVEDKAGKRPQNASWHTDVTYLEQPPRFAVLRAVDTPPIGGDTMWANMALAYDTLSDPMKGFLEGLTALHDAHMRANLLNRGIGVDNPDLLQKIETAFPAVEHSVVKRHPVTGRKVLYVNTAFTTRIVQLSESESRGVLDILFNHINTPDFHCRYRWTHGDVVIWDEIATQHYALPDHYPAHREMRRCTIDGDKLA